eukprot:6383245-Prymnesium_polylepis.1
MPGRDERAVARGMRLALKRPRTSNGLRSWGGVHERFKLPHAGRLAHGEEVDRDARDEDEDGPDECERVAPRIADARVDLLDGEAHVAQVDLGRAADRLEQLVAPVAMEEGDQRRQRVEDDGDADERVHAPAPAAARATTGQSAPSRSVRTNSHGSSKLAGALA